MAGAMLAHEEFQLVIKQLVSSDLIHHFPFLEELQPPSPPPAEAAPHHHLLRVLHILPHELRGKAVRASGPLALGLLAPKSQFKMALHTLVHMLPSKCHPLFPHPLSEDGLLGLFPGGQMEVPHVAVLDPPDTHRGQGRNAPHQLDCSEARVLLQLLLHHPPGLH
jgi:hypothetical protein